MHVSLAGSTGVLGRRIIPLLTGRGPAVGACILSGRRRTVADREQLGCS